MPHHRHLWLQSEVVCEICEKNVIDQINKLTKETLVNIKKIEDIQINNNFINCDPHSFERVFADKYFSNKQLY